MVNILIVKKSARGRYRRGGYDSLCVAVLLLCIIVVLL